MRELAIVRVLGLRGGTVEGGLERDLTPAGPGARAAVAGAAEVLGAVDHDPREPGAAGVLGDPVGDREQRVGHDVLGVLDRQGAEPAGHELLIAAAVSGEVDEVLGRHAATIRDARPGVLGEHPDPGP